MEKNQNCFIVYIKTDDIYRDIAEDIENRFDTSNYELDRPNRKNKKLIGLMKDELGGKVIKKFVGLGAKMYSYSLDDGSKSQKSQQGAIKRKLKFENYRNSLESTHLKNKINHLEKKYGVNSLIKDHK